MVLVGLVDQSEQLSAMLKQAVAGGGEVVVLVPVPAEHAAGFTSLGGLRPVYWQDQPVAEGCEPEFVDRPTDQAIAVVKHLAGLPEGTAAEEVCVGLGDETAAEAVARCIELAGTPARVASGASLRRSGPIVLLEVLSRFAAGRGLLDLAAVVRHPDLAEWLGESGAEDAATVVDRYATDFLQVDLSAQADASRWSDQKNVSRIRQLTQRIETLLKEGTGSKLATETKAWPAWAEAIAGLLSLVYGRRELRRGPDQLLVEQLELIGHGLREMTGLQVAAEQLPQVDFAEAVSLLIGKLASERVPAAAGRAAVELVGFLEMPWDDAPHAVLTDLNEGHLPAGRMDDAFLPDGLRAGLGMPDGRRRLARDGFLLSLVLRSRRSVKLLACRESAAGDPRVPSRLLLTGSEIERARRLAAFYTDDPAPETDAAGAPLLLTPGKSSEFLIPPPLIDAPSLDRLRVTAFRDYLSCPYRFYLRHVQRLDTLDDRAVELTGAAYGNLTHDVLQAFGQSDVAAATDAQTIALFLNDTLSSQVLQRYGRHARPAVRVQIEQLRERLDVFADRQAALTREGWRIRGDLVEKLGETQIEIDGRPFVITGQIDRVDEHPQHGVRLLDYKSSEAGDDPDKKHRRGGRWVDLQLPLYLSLVRPWGIEAAELGYFNLPKDAADAGVKPAGWSAEELKEAMSVRDQVIRRVREGIFWPPSEQVPSWSDAFSRLAADGALGRADLIVRSNNEAAATSPRGPGTADLPPRSGT